MLSQVIGVSSITALTVVTMLPITMIMSAIGYLRVKPEEEARGLDYKVAAAPVLPTPRAHAPNVTCTSTAPARPPLSSARSRAQFGNAASSYIVQKNVRLRACFLTLDAYGVSIDELLVALKALKNIIILPFSPQSSDTMIEAQVTEVLSRFKPADDAHEFLGFLSHHKSDAGDAARIFVDTARRVINKSRQEEEDAIRLEHMDALERLSSANGKAGDSRSDSSASKPRRSSFTAGPQDIFLDSNNLTDLKQLIKHVKSSTNHMLMLSRASLERPYVLCELAVAFRESKQISIIKVDWPGEAESAHGRAFTFPRHLNEAIEEWEEIAYFQRARSNESDMEYRPLDGLEKAVARCGVACDQVWNTIKQRLGSEGQGLPGWSVRQGSAYQQMQDEATPTAEPKPSTSKGEPPRQQQARTEPDEATVTPVKKEAKFAKGMMSGLRTPKAVSDKFRNMGANGKRGDGTTPDKIVFGS